MFLSRFFPPAAGKGKRSRSGSNGIERQLRLRRIGSRVSLRNYNQKLRTDSPHRLVVTGIPFTLDLKYKARVRERRGQCLSPRSAALNVMVMYYVFRSYHNWGNHSGGVETAVSVSPVIDHVPRVENPDYFFINIITPRKSLQLM